MYYSSMSRHCLCWMTHSFNFPCVHQNKEHLSLPYTAQNKTQHSTAQHPPRSTPHSPSFYPPHHTTHHMTVLSRDEIIKAVREGKIHISDYDEQYVGPASYDLTLSNEFRHYKPSQGVIKVDDTIDYRKYTEVIMCCIIHVLSTSDVVVVNVDIWCCCCCCIVVLLWNDCCGAAHHCGRERRGPGQTLLSAPATHELSRYALAHSFCVSIDW